MGIQDKIKEIEAEMARTQKNKATEYHLGQLKAKLAKLRTQLQTDSAASKGGPGDGFDVGRYGDSRVALIGFPSVGKSTLLSQLTGTDSEAAAYEFTTLTCIPGVIHYNDAKVQLLDLPGIIEGAAQGKVRPDFYFFFSLSLSLSLLASHQLTGTSNVSPWMWKTNFCLFSCFRLCLCFFPLPAPALALF